MRRTRLNKRIRDRRAWCLMDLKAERRSGRDRRSRLGRTSILHVRCPSCGLPLMGRIGGGTGDRHAVNPRRSSAKDTQPKAFACAHCGVLHEEDARPVGFSCEVTFRKATDKEGK